MYFDAGYLLRKQKSLKRKLVQQPGLLEKRIAILGGSTTEEIANLLELILLHDGIRPIIYQSGYRKYFEDAVVDPSAIIDFRPDIIYLHTSSICIRNFPPIDSLEADFFECIEKEMKHYRAIWDALSNQTDALIIQNNFELPEYQLLGNLDAVSPAGRVRFINTLNLEFAREVLVRSRLMMNDISTISARMGVDGFHDARRYFSYKIITTPEGSLEMARSIGAIVKAIYGSMYKCLVLDLDNTLWGGVIGDDGVGKIRIGRETAEAEAYTAFQEYCLALRQRGILLAVCSKNNELTALEGLNHPDSLLKPSHFSCIKANWEPKDQNIRAIAHQLNLGLDGLVFVDDNPVERSWVSAQLPMVAVPDVGSDVTEYSRILNRARYFEPISLLKEDLHRAESYSANEKRLLAQNSLGNYKEYLLSLEMRAQIKPFYPLYLERITQLINKTNQYNLTTKRYTMAEIEHISNDPNYVTLWGKLLDKFGDNGLTSVVIGRRKSCVLHIETWLMSCRVLKRDFEHAMLDALVASCLRTGIERIYGYYIPTEKNNLVAEHYAKLGFELISGSEQPSLWQLNLAGGYKPRNHTIKEISYD